jgi:nitroreductase
MRGEIKVKETLKVIRERRTTRRFKAEQIKEEELQTIIEAGIYAPSAHNKQSWNFTVIQNADLIEELNIESKEAAKNFTDEIINKMANNDKFNAFYGAPTVIIVSGDKNGLMPQVDCAAATENMLIAAEALGIGSCWNGFVSILFNSEKGAEYKSKLNIPEGYTPYYAVLLGYKDARISNAPERKADSVQYIR